MSALLAPAEGQVQPCPVTGISCEKTTAVDPGTWMPLCVGTRWQYRKTYASCTDKPEQIVRVQWISTEEIVSQTRCRSGLVIRIDATPGDVQREYPTGTSADYREWFERNIATPQTTGYLVRGSAVYNFAPSSWSDPCSSLTDERLRKLDDEEPEFFFPLELGLKWSDRQREEEDYAAMCEAARGEGEFPNPGFYYWVVAGREDLALPRRKVRGAWHLRYFTLGGAPHRWFLKDVGVVKESFSHRGSYWEESSVLVAFKAGQGCGRGK